TSLRPGSERLRSVRLYSLSSVGAEREGPNSLRSRSALLAPAFGPFPSMAATNKFGRIRQVRETGQCEIQPDGPRTTCGPNQTRKDSNVPHTYDRRSIGSRALNCCVRAERKLAPGGAGYARQGGRRRKGGPGRGAGDVPQGRGRFPGPRSLSILFQNRGREAPRQSEGCSSWHGH